MTTKFDSPNLDTGSYELYRQELLAWREVTELRKEKQGIVIALTLPKGHQNQIREKVFDQLSLDDLKKEDGLDILLTFLDNQLKKDDLADSFEKFEEFEDFQRQDSMSITEFVASFDSRYRKIEKLKMTLPSEILAFKLLKKSNISKEEKMLVLTGMDYDNKSTLCDQAKKSLKKFKGDIAEGSSSSGRSVKLEPAFLAENEEALLAAGYVKQSWTRTYGRGGYGRGRGKVAPYGKKNPVGSDGKILTCRCCGSYRHLVAECPHTSHNLAKVNINDTISEDVMADYDVLFTGYNKRDISQLGMDARNCAVLDSACSSTVCGVTWLESYLNSMRDEDRMKIKTDVSEKMFKFGGGERLKSKGEYCLPAVIAGKNVTIKTDVVESDIPLLLSRSAMKKARMRMNMENDTANVFGKDISLNLTTSGHYCIPIDRNEEIPVGEVFAIKLDEMDKKDRYKTLVKLHKKFAHPPQKRLISLLQDAAIWKDEYTHVIDEVNENCDLCRKYSKIVEQEYENGDRVYYKREGGERWFGPASVVFQDGKVVFVRDGGIFVRVLPNRLIKIPSTGSRNKSKQLEFQEQEHISMTVKSQANETNDLSSHVKQELSEECGDCHENTHNEVGQNTEMLNVQMHKEANQSQSVKINDMIMYKKGDEWFTGTISSHEEKADGKYKHWYNVRDANNEELSVNLGNLECEKVDESERNEVSFMNDQVVENDEVVNAKLNELEKLMQFNSYEEVLDTGQRTLSSRWVVTSKNGKTKARVVARGFEERDLEITRDSPAVGKGALQLFLSIIGVEKRTVQTTVTKSAFLQGKEALKASWKENQLNDEEQTQYRQIIGQLNWAVQGSRPDMVFEKISMNAKHKQGEIEELIRFLKKTIKLKGLSSFIAFQLLDNTDLKRVIFTDGSLGNINYGTGSKGTYIVLMMDIIELCCPIEKNFNKIKSVVRSTLAAETHSVQDGLDAGFDYRKMLKEILGCESATIPIHVLVDGIGIVEIVYSTRMVDDKRLGVDGVAVQEMLKLQDLRKIHLIPGGIQLTNPLTEQGPPGSDLLKVLQSGQMIPDVIDQIDL